MLLTILYVNDLALACRFYSQVFGWSRTVDVPVYVEFQVAEGARLGLMPQGNTASFLGEELSSKMPSDGVPRAEIYVTVDDIERYVQALDKAGAVCTSPLAPRDWGDTVAYYLDFDGYVLAVATKTSD